jgi:2-polyprenyl-3-methyl-5-hydroxy-6-metoxy-1,4-benzoquinol methylase
MSIAIFYPRFDHPAIEERYASWQTQMRLRHVAGMAGLDFYDRGEHASEVVEGIEAPFSLVVTDPLIVISTAIGTLLQQALESSGAEIVVPVTNEARHAAQQRVPGATYLTLRELEGVFARIEGESMTFEQVAWDSSDPGVFLCRTDHLRASNARLDRFIEGKKTAVVSSVYVHRWSPFRAQNRDDLLPWIPATAGSLLELGCGEGALGALVKQRQRCRVIGIELDREAAAVARRRLDDVYTGDVRHLLEILDERFDCVVGSEIVEHVDDPWTLLSAIRRVTAPGGQLVLSIPNLANASIILDLIRGRFDYAYIGLTCAGHLRFFTRKSIAEMLQISGWITETIAPQRAGVPQSSEELIRALAVSGIAASADELLDTGYYVVARNGSR